MEINLAPDLETALIAAAQRQGMPPAVLAVNALRERFLGPAAPLKPLDEWEKGLLHSARPWGVSLSNSVLSSEGLYD